MNVTPMGMVHIKKTFTWADNKIVCPSLVCGPSQLYESVSLFNLLKPTAYVMHQKFNIQQFYALPTPYLCFVFI
jgi:hypothetical protein